MDLNSHSRMERLPDGRRIGYAEFGDPEGRPCFVFHGISGSRHQAIIADQEAKRRRLRIIGVDRPGYGLSEMAPHMTLLDWTGDIVALADRLEIERFAVVGLSAAGPYALACAHAIPERLGAVAVVSGMGIVTEPELQRMTPWRRRITRLIRRIPWAVRWGIWPWAIWARRHPDRFLDRMASRMAEPDQQVLTRPDIRGFFQHNIAEAFSQGGRGTAFDLVLFTRDWGFEPREVTAEVYLWHGEEDVTVSVSLARRIASDMPNAHLTVYPDEGHLIAVNHLDEIFDTLLSAWKAGKTS